VTNTLPVNTQMIFARLVKKLILFKEQNIQLPPLQQPATRPHSAPDKNRTKQGDLNTLKSYGN
jgi:hypothetical protein